MTTECGGDGDGVPGGGRLGKEEKDADQKEAGLWERMGAREGGREGGRDKLESWRRK